MTVPTPRTGTVTPIRTRKPTCLPPWPLMLVAGAEKAGKSYAAAQASASGFIGATYWIGVGEDAPDEYGAIPGARFEIVEHDGTYRGILAAVTAAAAQPRVDGKPNLLVIDSATRLWDLISGMAQADANARAQRKATSSKQPVGDMDARINMDQWNLAKTRWENVLDVLRGHDGPVVVTARLELVTVMNERGEPTKEKSWKVKAEKNLPYDVGVIVELPARGEALLTGVRSLRFQPKEDRTRYPDFTVEKLWTDLGVTEVGATAPRQHDTTIADLAPAQALLTEVRTLAEQAGVSLQSIVTDWASAHDGQAIKDTADVGGLEILRDDLAVQAGLARELAERQAAVA